MPAHTPDHLTDLLDRYGLSMDTDMEKIIIKSYQGTLSTYTQRNDSTSEKQGLVRTNDS